MQLLQLIYPFHIFPCDIMISLIYILCVFNKRSVEPGNYMYVELASYFYFQNLTMK